MSWQATSWAIQQQETTDPNMRFVLLCLANYAGPDGRNAFPAVGTLATDTGLSESTIRRKLQELEELNLVIRGNQAIAVAHIERADRRPVVYDLPISVDNSVDKSCERGVTVIPREGNGVSNTGERGVTEGVTGCQALTPDPPSDPPLNHKKRTRAPQSGSLPPPDESCRREIREYITKYPQYRDAPSTLALLSKVSVEEVKRELESMLVEVGRENLFTNALARRMKI